MDQLHIYQKCSVEILLAFTKWSMNILSRQYVHCTGKAIFSSVHDCCACQVLFALAECSCIKAVNFYLLYTLPSDLVLVVPDMFLNLASRPFFTHPLTRRWIFGRMKLMYLFSFHSTWPYMYIIGLNCALFAGLRVGPLCFPQYVCACMWLHVRAFRPEV